MKQLPAIAAVLTAACVFGSPPRVSRRTETCAGVSDQQRATRTSDRLVEHNATLRGDVGLAGAGTDDAAERREASWSAIEQMIEQRRRQNPAWVRAQTTPPFDPDAPAGFITDEEAKAAQRDAASRLRKDMHAAYTAGEKAFTIPPGQYRFSHNKGLTIRNWHDFSINGEGACFWFERPMEQIAADPRGLSLVNCSNVRITGLKLDFDPPVYIQATIQSIDPDAGEMTATIDPAWPAVAVPAGQFSIYDTTGKYVPQGTWFHKGATFQQGRRLHIRFDPRVMAANFDRDLLAFTNGRGAIRPGFYIVLNYRRGRSIALHNCDSVTLEDTDIYQSPGMGILEAGGAGGHVYRRLRLIRKPGTRRVHYGTADHFHSSNMQKGAQIIACEFAHTSDDNINLHGFFGYVWRVRSPKQVLVGTENPLQPGGLLSFYDPKHVTLQGEARIAAVEPLTDEKLIERIKAERKELFVHARTDVKVVTLEGPVATRPGSLVDTHMNCSAGFRIRDCYFHDSRSRGMLLSGARDGVVDNCIFDNVLSGIDIYMESWKYMEGAIPGNITVKDCLIVNCGSAGPGGGIASGLVPGGGPFVRKTWPVRNIRIVNNVIVDGSQIQMLYTDGGEIRGNVLIDPLPYIRHTENYEATRSQYGNPGYFPRTRVSAISVWATRNVDIKRNRVYLSGGGLTDGIVDVGDHCHNIDVAENALIRLKEE